MATFLNLPSQLEDLLREASASGGLLAAAEQTLGISTRLAELREQSEAWQNGVFSGLPAIRLLPAQNFTGGVVAAYAGSRKEILVNQRWWDQASEADRTAVLLEELGHALQDRYGDGAFLSGDRGQLFAADLLNLPLSDAQRAAITAENDSVSVLVDGVWIDANAAAYVGTVAADNLVGTDNAADIFSFAAGTFSVLGDDTIDGGVGNPNTLAFGSAINFSNDDAFENVSNVERVTLANGANLLTLGINTDAAGITTVVGGTGNDTIDGSLSKENLALIGGAGNDQLWAGSGDDTLTGDAGDDTFAFNSQNLDFNDSVAGGDGNDILTFATGGVINGGNSGGLVGVNGVETIRLSAEGNKLSIADGDANGLSMVLGGSGDDSIDASGRSGDANGKGLIFDMGSGDDSISGTQGKDTFRFAINELTGKDSIAAGQTGDTLEFTTSGSIGDNDLTLLNGSGITSLQLSSAGANSVQLGAKSNNTFDSILGGSASDDIDLSGRNSSTALYAGAGSDKITLNNSTNNIKQLSTQSGNDAIVVSAAALTTPNAVEQMSGGSNEDTLIVSDVLDTGLTNTSPASVSIYNQGAGGSYELEGTSEELYHDQTKVVSIDKLQLANGSNKILLGAKSQRALTDEVIGGSQNDVILADSDIFKALKLDGSDGNDMLGGGQGNDSLIGGNGNDTLIAGAGVDTLIGGAGIDVFRMDSSQFRSNDSIDGGTNVGGVDVLELWGESSVDDRAFAGVKGVEELVVVGDNADDGTDNSSAMAVQLGAMARASGITTIVVEDANGVYLDLAQLTSATTVSGGAGNDTIVGFAGADILNGGVGAESDTLELNATSTDLNRAGNDQLVNIEVIDASKSLSGVLINLAIQSETLSINGGNFSDTITGGLLADTLIGGAGNDVFLYSSETLLENGSNLIDTISGGTNTDRISVADGLSLANTVLFTKATSIEELYVKGTNASTIALDVTAQTAGITTINISEATADSTIDVSEFTTTGVNITGGGANDTILGGAAADSLTGGAGADSLTGGAGADSLVGGAGADRFIYSTLTDSLAGSSASTSGDTINDFVSLTDKIDVSAASLTAIQAVGGLLSGTGYTAAGTSNLGADIATAIGTGGGTLLANGAAIVNITSGTGAGNYLVLNNGTGGYSASDDAVIFLGSSSVVAGDFI